MKRKEELSKEEVDAILVKLLPDEKNANRRRNKLESFMYTRAQADHAWLEGYLAHKGQSLSEEEWERIDKESVGKVTASVLYEFEVHLMDEAYWKVHKCKPTPENIEARIMENQPGRWLARFPQNRGNKYSRNVSGAIYDAVVEKFRREGKPCDARSVYLEVSLAILWNPWLVDGDRVSECRFDDELGEWELVVVKPGGEVIGNPTKTIEEIAKESVLARSRKTGKSGRPLKLDDAFLGILCA